MYNRKFLNNKKKMLNLLAPSEVYLYIGYGGAGINSAYDSGIISRILW